uniref:phosphogluconate dehydrogenase (NADP(+)-dependent, decarboxylating) n=1 Tax=Cajanus cajan TaxID=3821 RepID=A0A151SV42_CAJCA|nr:6-phosphogluconate dehydrogenase, decarboxylating [Cajanus cajan]
MESAALSRIGLAGLAVMGQNLALNIAEKGFPISVYNRTSSKVDETVDRARSEGSLPLTGQYTPRDFVLSLQRPRSVIILVKAGAPVDHTIAALSDHLEPGDCIIDGGNEWYENTERRIAHVADKGLLYLGMGVSGGEDGARHGPSLMPGGDRQAYNNIQDILTKVAAQVEDGPCVTYIGEGGSGNFVKMVHNGIEYGDMQLISEAYDVLKHVGGLSNSEIGDIFAEWNRGELESFLIEITADIFKVKDEDGEGFLVDKILDKTGMKGTGKWTVQQAAELSIAAPTIAASLDCRYLSGLKEERESAAAVLREAGLSDELGEMVQRQAAWRRVVGLAVSAGISTPGMCASLAYFDTYRRARLPANLVQAQRDLFGAHTYERVDRPGAFHTEWTKLARNGVGALN